MTTQIQTLKNLTVRLPPNMLKDFKMICCTIGKSQHDIVMFLINDFIEDNYHKIKESIDEKQKNH